MKNNGSGVSQKQTEEPLGIRGCVQKYLFSNMLDCSPEKFKVIICDAPAAAVLNSCLRMFDLLEHGVALVEDLSKSRQPIICAPALYFFEPTNDSVDRIINDWEAKEPYKELHLFALSTTSDTHLQQLARSRLAQRVAGYKDMMLNFLVPERLVFHFDMQDEIPKLLLPARAPLRRSFLDDAATRLAHVLHVMRVVCPIVRYQRRSNNCETLVHLLLEKLAGLSCSVPGLQEDPDRHYEEAAGETVLIVVDRSFDTITPLMHHRTYQCLLEDLMPLDKDLYTQKFETRSGESSTREITVDEEDPYWTLYRHRSFVDCMVEFPKELKKLHSENPHLANKRSAAVDIAELSNITRVLRSFQKEQGRLSVHIDICTNISNAYQEQGLNAVCEAEQDIAAGRKSLKSNIETVRRITKDLAVPWDVRLRLLLLLAAATDTSEFSQTKKQLLIKQAELEEEIDTFSRLEQLTSRVGKLTMDIRSAKSAERDPYITQAYQIMEALVADKLDPADYAISSQQKKVVEGRQSNVLPQATANNKKSLRVAATANAMRGDRDTSTIDSPTSSSEKLRSTLSGLSPPATSAQDRAASLEGAGPSRGGGRVVFFVLGGVTHAEIRAAYEATREFGREFIIGGTSLLRPREFITALRGQSEENP
uniref:Uncharacterized protein TCIL3000_9_450 n=1 Tax=Trypanosoma congolense (strain IL3000) TaxID=1068625 RepID=G0UTD7_TRYCI|nr:unnamed protein product [Trypanosoma congolense IL3000]